MNVFFSDVLIKKFTYALKSSLIYNSDIMVNLPTLSIWEFRFSYLNLGKDTVPDTT